ncbi:hypothetical protein VTL71DRAFT_831 [Oculimacula yallundae]|uniref:Autophagy-related protein 27 n=1 Tax=Oculimacula yallundae TaxID=86028 RepID=A0ABR4D157_9HELO
MRLPRNSAEAALLSAILFPLLAAATGGFDCDNVVADKKQFKLSKLGGPRSALDFEDRGASFRNITYTIDICKPLQRESKDTCPGGTRVCAIERDINKETKDEIIGEIVPIAGELKEKGGGNMDAKWVRLATGGSNDDSKKEGLRLTMNGGFKTVDKKKRPQKAIVEFICDRNLEGTENNWIPEDKYVEKRAEGDEKKDDEKKDDGKKDDDKKEGEQEKNPSLKFFSYVVGETEDTLRLEWRTKYACEDAIDNPDPPAEKKPGWGFFTWFIIIAFLSTATYLIFGSWLNYNRYGARGWDLLPHGDTIRDVPYLFKDWIRRVLSTVQGGGSRGGYAAV